MNALRTEPLFDRQPYLREAKGRVIAARADAIALDRTIFYPAGGGQPGDRGIVRSATSERFMVVDTSRDRDDRALIWLHLDRPLDAGMACGDEVATELDWERRYDHMRIHTCLHLLCSLLRAPVTGCRMEGNKGSLDFDMPELEMPREEILVRLNELVARRVMVSTTLVAPTERERLLGLVRNRYALPPESADAVKVIDIENVDVQPCGGTHLFNTDEIRDVVALKIDNKGKANRRITVQIASLVAA
jgi:misacylated tRNA(Ala) deacylase